MDKIWDRKSFEVGGHWSLWRGWKNEWPRRIAKSQTLKKILISLKLEECNGEKWQLSEFIVRHIDRLVQSVSILKELIVTVHGGIEVLRLFCLKRLCKNKKINSIILCLNHVTFIYCQPAITLWKNLALNIRKLSCFLVTDSNTMSYLNEMMFEIYCLSSSFMFSCT